MTDKANLTEEINTILGRLQRPPKAVVTAGMPYANGPLHAGHLAGAQVPADIYARYMRMMIGADNVLFVNGTDDHGSNSQVAAKKNGVDTNEFINNIHAGQLETMKKYGISQDRVEAKGFGITQAVIQGNSAEANKANRRIEAHVTGVKREALIK